MVTNPRPLVTLEEEMDLYKKYTIKKYENDAVNEIEDDIIIEHTLEILINDKPLVKLLCTPTSLKELATGFLASEGIITSYSDMLDIRVNNEKDRAFIKLTDEMYSYFGDNLMTQKTITSGCGKGITIGYPVLEDIESIDKKKHVNPEKIRKLIKSFNKNSELFIKTGGVHSCALCSEDEIIYFEEDIGRHNALDKVIGKGIIHSINFEDKIVLSTGRLSSEIVYKALKRKIPVLISRSAPTDKAIDIATNKGITLVGFARGNRMNIY
jgi:FdhD protein